MHLHYFNYYSKMVSLVSSQWVFLVVKYFYEGLTQKVIPIQKEICNELNRMFMFYCKIHRKLLPDMQIQTVNGQMNRRMNELWHWLITMQLSDQFSNNYTRLTELRFVKEQGCQYFYFYCRKLLQCFNARDQIK